MIHRRKHAPVLLTETERSINGSSPVSVSELQREMAGD